MNRNKEIIDSCILITGGAGFIGSNLCEYFLQKNKVVCFDSFLTGRKENIESFLSNPQFELIEGDIRNLDDCHKAVNGVDYVLHQAALGSVPRSINDPITTNEINVSGFLNMLVAARDEDVKRFVYAASSSTYGDHTALPKIEDRIGKPLSPYAVTKLSNEHYASIFADLYEMEIIGLRYFNVFGKSQRVDGPYAAVIPKFIDALIDLKSPEINGDGLQTRDFTYVKNIVQMNELALLTNNKNALDNVYNVAYGENSSLIELFDVIVELLCEYNPKIKNVQASFGLERQGDIKHSLASIDKAKKLLGYKPKYNLRNGLVEAIDWYWNNYEQ